MAVGEGTFVLYSRIEPPLEAGDYRFTTTQNLGATGLGTSQLPVAELPTHVTVRSPRYVLPPDQVLSTFPPAGSEGAYGARLPQVVIRRRTLPWERLVQAGLPRSTPWLALVLIAEGEAELKLNQPVAECVTPGRTLAGKADVELANYLLIRKSVVDRVFPTRLDVPLLAHAREVDIHDTELMMGDDDGFLAVVISNRLPLPGRGPDGRPVPVKYLACLVNLESQFMDLLEKAPAPSGFTTLPNKAAELHASLAQWDHTRMGRLPYGVGFDGPKPGGGPTPHTGELRAQASNPDTGSVVAVPSSAAAAARSAQQVGWSSATAQHTEADVYVEMARDFSEAVIGGFVAAAGGEVAVDPTLRFPVLLHWSFTSFGQTTFRSLVEGLDSGLLGTIGEDSHPPEGRLPLEVVETGHTGLAHRIRRGDQVRSWYRGPFVPHPTTDPPGGRLPLAHAADQLRIVVPDGREDISLAAAFEIGRLLALSRPSMIAALMRWRQDGYQVARRGALWKEIAPFVEEVLGREEPLVFDPRVGVMLGRGLVDAVVKRPQDLVGDPSPLVTRGLSLPVDGAVEVLVAQGFGLSADALTGDPVTVLRNLREAPVLRPSEPSAVRDPQVRAVLTGALEQQVTQLVADVLAVSSEGAPRPERREPDALDRLLERGDEDEG
ncbi:MAG TPA: hypothetical protein VFR67_28520 [Pilimelia sp.]|nr:hypothetical protein [Pilimelia sp.]